MIFLFLLMLFLSPRVILFFVWLFDYARFALVFGQNSFWLPFLGFLFLPWTTLAYLFSYNPVAGQLSMWGWFWVILGLLADLSSYGSARYRRRKEVVAE